MSALTDRFDAIAKRIEGSLAASGRPGNAARLVAVSKFHEAEKVAELAAHWTANRARETGDSAQAQSTDGPVFGESYMQEARDKMPQVADLLAACAPGVYAEWHFIGHLQSKKAKDVVGKYALIHSVDSVKLAKALDKAWQERAVGIPVHLDAQAPKPQDVLIQVNVGREPQKSGVAPEALEALLQETRAMQGIRVQGLMCIPPLAKIGQESRPYFVMLRELRDMMRERLGLALPHLSMGMSDDFEAAIEEGATLVRIGTDIFGPRM